MKEIIERLLRGYPPAFRMASRVYHKFNSSFRSLSAEAPGAIERAVTIANSTNGDDPGDYYEFGLFRGFTFLTAYQTAESLGISNMQFHGFDSFEGLPDLEG